MLKCKDVVDHSSDYLDHSMPFGKRLSVCLHIVMCRYCRRYLRYYQTVTTLLSTAEKQEENEMLVDEVMMRIDSEKNRSS